MTDDNSNLHVFRRLEDVPRFQEPKNDIVSQVFRKGRTGEFWPMAGGMSAVVAVCINNMRLGIFPFARIWMHVGGFAAAYAAMGWVDHVATRAYAQRDAMMHHYISLHPEDFVEEPAPKLKYVLYPWVPMRETWTPFEQQIAQLKQNNSSRNVDNEQQHA